ncbi:hypothetical protein MHU86_1004 [Fragilaria crotonensis]|nr:hypothetical protein MHU86_1004 [Fragilaria crotonensis]
MGSDNAKSSHRTRRIKERPSPQRSVDARSVGSRSAEESRHGRSNRSNGSAHDHGSVASSQSSALVVDAGAYKEMSNRHRRGRTPDPKSTGSSGCMKQSIFVSALLIAWVLFYVGKTFPEQVADAIGSIIQMNTAEDKISASSTHEQVDDEGGKAGDAEVNNVKENDPDTDLAALASGAGTNLWENVIQTPDPNDESAKSSDVAAGDSSTSSLSTGESTDDRPTKASGEKNEKMATRDVSLSKARSSNGDATKEISTSSNDPAMSDGQHSEGVDAATKSEDTTDSELTQSGNSIGGANNKQIDTPQMSDAQSVDANILDGETEQQVQFEGQENELQQSTGSPMGDSRDVRGSQDGSSNESTHDDASNGQQVGDEGVSDVDQGRLEESDGVQRTGGKQGKLRGSNTLQSIGGDQEDIGSMDASNNMSIQDDASNEQQEGDEGVGGVDQDLPHESSGATLPVEKQNKVRVSNTLRTNTQPLAEDNLSTSLRGSVEMQIPDDQGQITAMNLQTSQGDTLVDNGDPQRQGDVDTESMSLGDTTRTQDSLLQQDGGLLADDMPIRNGGGNGMILDDSGLQAVDGSMKDERQQGGVMMQSHATRPDIGGETAAGEGATSSASAAQHDVE